MQGSTSQHHINHSRCEKISPFHNSILLANRFFLCCSISRINSVPIRRQASCGSDAKVDEVADEATAQKPIPSEAKLAVIMAHSA
jgi:hypothetical protein